MQKAILAIVVIVILGAGGLALTRNSDNSNKNSASQSGNNTSQPTPVSTNAVTIHDLSFSPADITVAKGTKVTWTNNDATTHTVTENDGQTGPDSGQLGPGQSYSFTYNQTGTFKYHCTIHTEMTGTVTVTDVSNAAPQSSTPSNNNDTGGSATPPAYPY